MDARKRRSRRMRLPPQSSNKFVRFLTRIGAEFVRQGATSHAIYKRTKVNTTYTAVVKMGARELRPEYQMDVLRQLGFSREEIQELIEQFL